MESTTDQYEAHLVTIEEELRSMPSPQYALIGLTALTFHNWSEFSVTGVHAEDWVAEVARLGTGTLYEVRVGGVQLEAHSWGEALECMGAESKGERKKCYATCEDYEVLYRQCVLCQG